MVLKSPRPFNSMAVTFLLSCSLLILLSPGAGTQTSLPAQNTWPTVIGTDKGLYGMDRLGIVRPLWTGGAVRKILKTANYWAILGDQGILVSTDLLRWETRNRGLPVKTIKNYDDGQKTFTYMVQELKDLEALPEDPETLVCATKDTVFLSRDAGKTWESLGAPPYRTNGIKAVAATLLPAPGSAQPALTVFLSHSTYGIYYRALDSRNAGWVEMNQGLERLETTTNPDEVSDIAVAVPTGSAGNGSPRIYVSQTFRRRIYQLNWEQKRFTPIWSDSADFGTVDSLDIGAQGIRFVQEGAVMELNYPPAVISAVSSTSLVTRDRPDLNSFIRQIPSAWGIKPSSLISWGSAARIDEDPVTLSELWLLDTGTGKEAARGKQGLYLPVNHAMESRTLAPYLKVIEESALDMVVIDMKDDYGRLRFSPNNPAIPEKGRVFRPVDIDAFLKTMQDRGIYTVARIVVFKDPELARKEGGKFAVWDSHNRKPWVGYYDQRQPKGTGADKDSSYETAILSADDPTYEILRTYYDERWVDPYSEEVWEYTAAIAGELIDRGFDEIQFDYIRFPTDGANLGDAQYRWRENGMDMDSAILSFLRHIRSRITAPISIDIYGANGWYRTGARTGQEVELLAPYVDVICPMYYPSHFEQDFLAQSPAEQRPYRIYFQGSQRTERIGRGQIIVRPYVQAFFLNVSYDRQYYNPDYVRRQVEGVRDAGANGLTYWNNSGRYDDIPLRGAPGL
ncbi:putative glycoside hydrolase [Treponema primitia]|uniref:putative glycoside hydrolase n=1 Tax=Treponema primitia TaxID=88058 RepID=UPI00031D0305|nr:putative glycoside hydrolase [Treponema primitia]